MWAPTDEKANVQMLVKCKHIMGSANEILDVHLEGKK